MIKNNILILIPPSEGKNEGGIHSPLKSVCSTTKFLLKETNEYPNQDKLLGVKGTVLEKAININKSVLTSNTMDAIHRYTGVVYNGINYNTLKNKQLFNERVCIISGLFGLIKPDTLIPNYKLKIDKFKAATLWLPIITKQLKGNFIIDLLPQVHKKAVRYDNGVEVEFVFEKNEKKINAGHAGKFIKGKFVRFLIENNITNPEDFKQFNEDGFVWTGEYFLKRV